MPQICYHCLDPEHQEEEKLATFVKVFSKRRRGARNVPCWRAERDEPYWKDSVGTLLSIADKCAICVANAYRRGLVDKNSIENISNVDWKLVSKEDYKKGYTIGQEIGILDRDHFEGARPAGLQGAYFFDVPKNQFGEAYHALVAAILMPRKCVAIRPGKEHEYSEQAKDLLNFYSIPPKFTDETNKHASKSAKDVTTEVIAQYFRTYKQSLLFTAIRSFLDRDPPRGHKPPQFARYATQSYLGKYWLNRYLSVTNQLAHGPHMHKLPKDDIVDRIAVIVIRRDAQTGAGKIMDETNLEACLETIEKANNVARADDGKFTHVLLYGDIQAPEGKKYAERYEAAMTTKGIQLLYISKPWAKKLKKDELHEDELYEDELHEAELHEDKLFQETQNFWAEFRAEKTLRFPKDNRKETYFSELPDGAPLQVRILSFFLALQARYKSKLCYIGFRSGFLDGAAFIGSPIFYLDDSWWDALVTHEQTPPTPLYRTTELSDLSGPPNSAKRMIAAGNAIDTFIRIDVKKDPNTNTVKLSKPEPILLGALYIYMLAKNPGLSSGVYWQRRCSRLNNEDWQKTLEGLYDRTRQLPAN